MAELDLVSDSSMVSGRESTAVELHNEAMQIASEHKRCEIKLFEVISRIEMRQAYLDFEVTSLYTYCVELLGLSGHTAYNFIDVVRTSQKVPALAEAILSSKTTISKARKICSVITEENQKEWIDLAIQCSARVIERAVAAANPRAAVFEMQKYISSEVLEIKFAVSEQ